MSVEVMEVEEDIKKILSQLLQGQEKMNSRLDNMDGRLYEMNTRLDGMNIRLDGMDARLDNMESRLDGMDGRLGNVESKLDGMDARLDRVEVHVVENTHILKSLEHAAQVNKAEIDKLSFEVAEIKGDVKNIKNDLSAVERITIKNWGDIVELKSIK
jgi:chromosome segregation ATPase